MVPDSPGYPSTPPGRKRSIPLLKVPRVGRLPPFEFPLYYHNPRKGYRLLFYLPLQRHVYFIEKRAEENTRGTLRRQLQMMRWAIDCVSDVVKQGQASW